MKKVCVEHKNGDMGVQQRGQKDMCVCVCGWVDTWYDWNVLCEIHHVDANTALTLQGRVNNTDTSS